MFGTSYEEKGDEIKKEEGQEESQEEQEERWQWQQRNVLFNEVVIVGEGVIDAEFEARFQEAFNSLARDLGWS